MNKKQIISIAIVVGLIILVILGFIFIKGNGSKVKPNDKSGDPVSGMYDKDSLLINNVTSDDYFVIQKRISEFLETKKVAKNSTVTIKTVNPYPRDGTKLDFTADIQVLNLKSVEVKIDYTYSPYPKFSIPSQNFSVPLYGATD